MVCHTGEFHSNSTGDFDKHASCTVTATSNLNQRAFSHMYNVL